MTDPKDKERSAYEEALERASALVYGKDGNDTDDAGKIRARLLKLLGKAPPQLREHLWVAELARDMPAACEDLPPLDQLVAAAKSDYSYPDAMFGVPDQPARSTRPMKLSLLAAGLAGAALLGFLLGKPRDVEKPPLVEVSTVATASGGFTTSHSQQLMVSLPEGSVVHLDSDSEAMVGFDGDLRMGYLKQGRARFNITADPKREFLLVTNDAEVESQEAAFDVLVRNGKAIVTVIEGVVTVHPPSTFAMKPPEPPKTLTLRANQQVTISAKEWPVAPVAVDAMGESSWIKAAPSAQ